MTHHPDSAGPAGRSAPEPADIPEDAERPRRLRHCLPGDVVTTQLGEIAVLLHPTSTGRPRPVDDVDGPSVLSRYDLVEVYATGRVRHLPADTLVTPVTDPTVQLGATRAAVDALAQQRRADVHTQDTLRTQYARVMADIRAFAIERHVAGETDAEELNEFLVHFGLLAYDPRLQVAFTLTGCFEVNGEAVDITDVRQDAARHVRVQVDDVEDLIPDTLTVHVSIDSVTAVDTPTDTIGATADGASWRTDGGTR